MESTPEYTVTQKLPRGVMLVSGVTPQEYEVIKGKYAKFVRELELSGHVMFCAIPFASVLMQYAPEAEHS